MNLDDITEDLTREDSPGVQSVKSLFDIKDKNGKSDIDLKTELTDQEIIANAMVEFIVELSGKDLSKEGFVLAGLTDKFKRLKVSRLRQGRTEAVNIFKSELNEDSKGAGFLSRFFKPKEG